VTFSLESYYNFCYASSVEYPEFRLKFWPPAGAQIFRFMRYSNPITDLDSPTGFQEVETPRFQENRDVKVVKLSAIRTGRLYPQALFLVRITVKG
jgi:hypothetical protein